MIVYMLSSSSVVLRLNLSLIDIEPTPFSPSTIIEDDNMPNYEYNLVFLINFAQISQNPKEIFEIHIGPHKSHTANPFRQSHTKTTSSRYCLSIPTL